MRLKYPLLIACAAVALAVPSIALLPAGPAHAQEATLTETKIPELIDFVDRDKRLQIQLPRSWTVDKDVQGPQVLVGMRGIFKEGEEQPTGLCVLFYDLVDVRAIATALRHQRPAGELVNGTTKSGKGWYQNCVRLPGTRGIRFSRAIEHENRVYFADLYIPSDYVIEEFSPIADAILSTLSVVSHVPSSALDDRFKKSKAEGLEVWTDSENSNAVKDITKVIAAAREAVEKALPGKPLDRSTPVVRLYQRGVIYDEHVRAATGVEHEVSSYSVLDSALLVKIMSAASSGGEQPVGQEAATQYMMQYFGARPPSWVISGLRFYAAASNLKNAKPDKPVDEVRTPTRHAIRESKPLDYWFTAKQGDDPDQDRVVHELFGWHFWLLHGKAPRDYRKAYASYMEILRDTGDEEAAVKAWEGTDFRKMQEEFKAFGEKWD